MGECRLLPDDFFSFGKGNFLYFCVLWDGWTVTEYMRLIYGLTRCVAIVLAAAVIFGAAPAVCAKDFVITLDAGHGGHDYGALGEKSNEKTITLEVVKELGQLLEKNLPDVKVVYTRDKDEFIPLNDRARIANKAGSDLFMSVHINSVDKRNRNRRSIEGCQVYTLGLHKTAENLAVAKRENSVMELEADHTEKYAGFDPNSLESDIVFELSQSKRLDQSIEFADAIHGELVKTAGRSPKGVRQAGFWVLWATSMPAVLVELDFICNPTSERYMASSSGRERLAIALYNAICAYVNTYGSQLTGRKLKVAHALTTSGKPAGAAVPVGGSVASSEVRFVDDSEPAPAPANVADTPAPTKGKDGGIPQVESRKTSAYFVQLLASSAPLSPRSSELKGVKDVEYYMESGLYKYVTGDCRTLSAAKKLHNQLKRKFPDCFIVKIEEGKRTEFIKP